MIFETIKEFEDYIFSIETAAQLTEAKYSEADIIAYYENFGERARAIIQSDISKKLFNIWRKKNPDFMAQMRLQAIQAFTDPARCEDILIEMGEKTDKEFVKFRRAFFPLVKALNINHMNLEDEGNAMMLNITDIAGNLEDMEDFNSQNLAQIIESNPMSKDILESFSNLIGIRYDSDEETLDVNENNPSENNHLSKIINRTDKPFPEELLEKIDIVIKSEWFSKTMKEGLIVEEDGHYLWKGNRQELALFGELICDKLNFKNKWNIIQPIFNVKNLAQYKHKVTGDYGCGRFGPNEKKINQIFGIV